MSKSINAIKEIKNLMVQFGFLAQDEPTLLSFKLEDNTILQVEKLEAGNKIFKINEEFEQVNLEDGTYHLVENFNVEVKDGEIVTVSEIFVDVKLLDGTQIKVEGDGLVEGAKVMVVTDEGDIVAPDGVHELEDGAKVETKEGVIVMIEKEEEIEEVETPAEEASENEVEGGEDVLEMLKDFIVKVGQKMEIMEQKMNRMEGDFNSFKKEPAGKKISDGKTEFTKTINNDDDMDARIAAIMSLRNKK